MKRICLSLILCAPFFLAPAMADEAGDRQAVIAIVQNFFDAMAERNVDDLRRMLTSEGIFYGYREGPDGLQVSHPTHQQFVDGLAGGDRRLVERFWDPQVLLHDRIAVVWAPYDLYVDGSFSHCGMDSFNFLRMDDGWKITGVLYSMESGNCAESPLGPLQDGQ